MIDRLESFFSKRLTAWKRDSDEFSLCDSVIPFKVSGLPASDRKMRASVAPIDADALRYWPSVFIRGSIDRCFCGD